MSIHKFDSPDTPKVTIILDNVAIIPSSKVVSYLSICLNIKESWCYGVMDEAAALQMPRLLHFYGPGFDFHLDRF